MHILAIEVHWTYIWVGVASESGCEGVVLEGREKVKEVGGRGAWFWFG
jgi:hypothetical protein